MNGRVRVYEGSEWKNLSSFGLPTLTCVSLSLQSGEALETLLNNREYVGDPNEEDIYLTMVLSKLAPNIGVIGFGASEHMKVHILNVHMYKS